MKDLLILFRYISLSKRRKTSSHRINLSWIGYIIPAIAFGLPVGFVIYAPLKNLPMELSELLFSMFITSSSILFILGYAPTIVFNLFGSSDVYFLLTLPIKRTSIFLFKAIDSIIYSIPAVGFILPGCIAYSIAIGKGWVIGSVAGILFIIFLITVSLLFGAIVSKVMSRTSARILSNLIYLLTVLVYVVILNVIKPDTSSIEGIKNLTYSSKTYLENILYYILPTGWLISMIRGEPIKGFFLLGISMLFGLLVYKISDTLVIESMSSKNSKKVSFSKGSSGSPFFTKDIKLLYRDPQSIYMLLYSIVFPLIILIGNKSYTGAILVMATIASFYCSYITAHLLVMEKKVWPLPRLFPIKLKNLLLWKVLIPSLIYSLLYLAITIFSIYIFNLNSIILLTIPMISIAFLYSGILAIRFFFKDPTRDISSRNIFRIGEVITIELTTMGIVAGIIAPFTVYTSPIVLQGQYKNIIGIGIPVLVSLIVIYISIKMTKGITEKIDAWE